MTRDEARQVLLLHRPWATDAPDPDTVAALAFAQGDPELRAWFEGHCALQVAVRASIRAPAPPEAFREQIVSECLARKRSVSRRTMLTTVTALLLIGVGIEAFVLFGDHQAKEEVSFAAYKRRMSREALRMYRMDLETADANEIRTFLAARQSPANYTLPAALGGIKTTGCLATKWQGRPVSMICFHTGKPLAPGQTSDLFLFVIARDSLPGAPADSSPTFAQINRLAMASWSENGNTYLLATEHGEEVLRKNL